MNSVNPNYQVRAKKFAIANRGGVSVAAKKFGVNFLESAPTETESSTEEETNTETPTVTETQA